MWTSPLKSSHDEHCVERLHFQLVVLDLGPSALLFWFSLTALISLFLSGVGRDEKQN